MRCTLNFYKVPEWPTTKMAKILSQSCTDSDDCSEKLFSRVLHKCINSENKMEDYLNSMGTTEVRNQAHMKD